MSDKGAILGFIAYVAKVSEAMAIQAGVGGMETAGGIISYLAKHPDKLDAFLDEGVFGFPDDWLFGGCLTWHGQNGKIVHPDYARRAKIIKRLTTQGDQSHDRG